MCDPSANSNRTDQNRNLRKIRFEFEAVGFEAVGFEAVGFEAVGFGRSGLSYALGSHMCTPTGERGGGPIACLVLVSSLNLRKERRKQSSRVDHLADLPGVTHVYPDQVGGFGYGILL